MTNIKRNLKNLSLDHKIIGIGSFLVLISCFLPWYQEYVVINSKNIIGDEFLAITGPGYLVGVLLALFSVFSLGFIATHVFKFRTPRFSFDEGTMNVFLGVQSLIMVGILASIYFHSKFGVDISNKEVGYGMIMNLIGISFMILGGLKLRLSIRNNIEQKQDFVTAKIDNLVGEDLVQDKKEEGLEKKEITEGLTNEDFEQPLEQLLEKHETKKEYEVGSFYKPDKNIEKDTIVDKVEYTNKNN